MEGFQYSYLLMNLLFLGIWLLLYKFRPDLRHEMLAMSLPLGVMGLLLTVPYANDWWKPGSITGSLPSAEDFLFGFTSGGIASVIYAEVFRKRVQRKRATNEWRELQLQELWKAVAVVAAGFFLLHYGFSVNTLVITALLLGVATIVVLARRPDLWQESLASGISMVLIAAAVYAATDIITPGWVDGLWSYQNVPRIIILGLPVEEVLFYFLYGAVFGPYYEVLVRGKLVEVPA